MSREDAEMLYHQYVRGCDQTFRHECTLRSLQADVEAVQRRLRELRVEMMHVRETAWEAWGKEDTDAIAQDTLAWIVQDSTVAVM